MSFTFQFLFICAVEFKMSSTRDVEFFFVFVFFFFNVVSDVIGELLGCNMVAVAIFVHTCVCFKGKMNLLILLSFFSFPQVTSAVWNNHFHHVKSTNLKCSFGKSVVFSGLWVWWTLEAEQVSWVLLAAAVVHVLLMKWIHAGVLQECSSSTLIEQQAYLYSFISVPL